MHDFIVTRDHVVFPVFPASLSMENFEKHKSFIAWTPEMGASFGVLERKKPGDAVRWITAPLCYVYHFMNAFDDGGDIVVDACVYETVPNFPGNGITDKPPAL